MANSDSSTYNHLFTNVPIVLSEQKEDYTKICSKVASEMKKAIVNITSTIPNWKDYENQEDTLKLLTLLEKAKNEYVQLHANRLECVTDINLLSTAIKSNKLPPTGEDYASLLSTLKNDQPPINYTQKVMMDERSVNVITSDIMKAIEDARKALQDDDIMAYGATQPSSHKQLYRCPVTLTVMVEPMRNSNCTHRYSKTGIMGLLRNRTHIECPVHACGKTVTRESLIMDEDYAREIEAYKLNEMTRRFEKPSGGTSNTVMDEDED